MLFLILRQCHILPPILKQDFKIIDFAVQTNTTIGMHCRDLVEVLAGLTKTTKISCAKEPDLELHVGNERVHLDLVEDILIMQLRVHFPRVEPELVEPNSFVIGLYIVEASIWQVL